MGKIHGGRCSVGRVGHGPPKILVGWATMHLAPPIIVYSLILHCAQLIIRKISKIGASRYQILRLKCTKFTFCWGSAPDPCIYLRGLQPTSKGMEGNGRGGRKGKGEGKGEVEGGIWPTQKFWCGTPMEKLALLFKQ